MLIYLAEFIVGWLVAAGLSTVMPIPIVLVVGLGLYGVFYNHKKKKVGSSG